MNKEELLHDLRKQGFSDKIVKAFAKIRREDFIRQNLRKFAYENIALPIDDGGTISQPYTIALMLSLLKLHENQKIMEIGSGCGYVLALISEIIGKNGKIFGIEISQKLAEKSMQTLKDCRNIFIFNKNGKSGLAEESPFDRILIDAALEEIPGAILNQLKEGGIIVAPIGPTSMQTLTSMKRHGNNFPILKRVPGFVFVPFIY